MVNAGLVMFPIKFEFIQNNSNLSGLETVMVTYRVQCTDHESFVDIFAIGMDTTLAYNALGSTA